MMDDIWSKIESHIRNDPRKERSYDEGYGTYMASKDFLDGREWNLANEIGSDKSTNLDISYTFENLAEGATAIPTVTRDGGTGAIVYRVVSGEQNCNVNFTTGLLRINKIGYCRVMARASASSGWAASLDIEALDFKQQAGRVTITPMTGIVYGTEEAVEFTTLSSSSPVFTVAGPCTYSNGMVMALSGEGECSLTIEVPGDADFTSATANIKIPMIRVQGDEVVLTDSKDFKTTLPKGGSIDILKAPDSVVGGCQVTGLKLTATTASGSCVLTYAAYNTATHSYPQTVHRVVLTTGTQTFASTVTKATKFTKKKNTRVLLSKTRVITTNFGAATSWVTNGQCRLTTSGNNIYVAVKTKTTCRISLKSKSIFGLPAITRNYTVGY
jgi:hypothetical protein